METNRRVKDKRGGKREGAGRKSAFNESKNAKSVSITTAHEEKILSHYQSKNLSQALEKIAIAL